MVLVIGLYSLNRTFEAKGQKVKKLDNIHICMYTKFEHNWSSGEAIVSKKRAKLALKLDINLPLPERRYGKRLLIPCIDLSLVYIHIKVDHPMLNGTITVA